MRGVFRFYVSSAGRTLPNSGVESEESIRIDIACSTHSEYASSSFFVHTAEKNLRGTTLAATFYVPTRLSQILQPPLSMSTAPASVYGA
jgi:hypothetical protein